MGSRAHLPRRLDGLGFRAPGAVGARPAAWDPRLDARSGPVGALRPRLGLEPSQRPRGAAMPEKLAQLKEQFAIEAARNSVFPIGGGLWIPVFHPELRISTPYREWNFTGDITRMPEFCAPALGNRANVVTIDAEMPENGERRAVRPGGRGRRSHVLPRRRVSSATSTTCSSSCGPRSAPTKQLPAGRSQIQIETTFAESRPAARWTSRMSVNGEQSPRIGCRSARRFCSPPTTASTSARCLGGRVSLDYYDRAPFPFNGTIHQRQRPLHLLKKYRSHDDRGCAEARPDSPLRCPTRCQSE